MMMNKNKLVGYGLVLAAALLMTSDTVFVEAALDVPLGFFFFFASTAPWSLLLLRKQVRRDFAKLRDFRRYKRAFLGSGCIALSTLFFDLAMKYVRVSTGAVINQMEPLANLVIDVVWFRRRPSLQLCGAVSVLLGGVVLCEWKGLSEGDSANAFGAALMLLATVFDALFFAVVEQNHNEARVTSQHVSPPPALSDSDTDNDEATVVLPHVTDLPTENAPELYLEAHTPVDEEDDEEIGYLTMMALTGVCVTVLAPVLMPLLHVTRIESLQPIIAPDEDTDMTKFWIGLAADCTFTALFTVTFAASVQYTSAFQAMVGLALVVPLSLVYEATLGPLFASNDQFDFGVMRIVGSIIVCLGVATTARLQHLAEVAELAKKSDLPALDTISICDRDASPLASVYTEESVLLDDRQ